MRTLLTLVLLSVIHITSAHYLTPSLQFSTSNEKITCFTPFTNYLNTTSNINNSNSKAINNNFRFFQNRWKSTYLHNQYGGVQDGNIESGWWSAQWTIEDAGSGYVRIKNRWKNTYLHNQYGEIQAGNIESGWWSAQWILEDAGSGYVRIKNRWKSTYLHNQYGKLQLGNIESGWWSAQWQIQK
jgi:hypothetical protein